LEKINTAFDLLIKTIVLGHKEGGGSIVDADWVIPIELKWDIEKFLETVDE